MSDTLDRTRQRIAVLGAGGRIGSAVTTALLRAGRQVTAVVRDPTRHTAPDHPRLHVTQGDARHVDSLAAALADAGAVVLAVTPYSTPPESFTGFDLDYYAMIATGIDKHWQRPVRRFVAVGLTATLRLDTDDLVMDDPQLFPPRLRPFAESRVRELVALRGSALDWAILTPPAGYPAERPTAGQGYRLVTEPVTRAQAMATLSLSTYADAVADETITPTVHAARVLVVPATAEGKSVGD